MGKGNFSDDFKRDAMAQITVRGYPVAEVSQRLGVSPHLLYAWKRKFSQSSVSGGDDKDAEIRRLKTELARVTEERDIFKKPPRISPRMQSETRVRCRASPECAGLLMSISGTFTTVRAPDKRPFRLVTTGSAMPSSNIGLAI